MTGSALYTRWLVVVQLLAENEPRERILYIFSCIRSDQNWERILRIFSCIRSKLHIDCEGQVKLTWRKLVHWRQCLWNFIWCKSEKKLFYVCLKTFCATLRKYTQSQKKPFHHDSFSGIVPWTGFNTKARIIIYIKKRLRPRQDRSVLDEGLVEPKVLAMSKKTNSAI